jgi:deoxyribodipyrimidine photo-lyase
MDSCCPPDYQIGGASKWWLHQSLTSLDDSLNNQLHVQQGDAAQLILDWVTQHNIRSVTWNRCYEPWQIQRDAQLKQALIERGVEVKSFNGSLLWEPWQVLKKDQTPYRVFTPYYRKGCLAQSPPRLPLSAPENMAIEYMPNNDSGLSSLKLLPSIPWYQSMESLWQPGEQGASTQLSEFLPEKLDEYKAKRDFPNIQGTSRLSPHLHFGEVSVNQIWYAAMHRFEGQTPSKGLDHFLSELGWREFSYYLLYHFPTIPEQNFNPKFEFFQWHQNPTALKAWQQGQTGIPMVDAGMRELWQTGTMHNRVRMIVGSFLVKNLLIDWREGAKWFWDCLLDADLASNSASWQWVAGTGADAAPYFRIFNPVTQGQKFDPDGEYVRRYCPELASLPTKYIHEPWSAPTAILEQAEITLGEDYPQPIVDLKASRQRALDNLQLSKEQLLPKDQESAN